ncbi:MAG: GNAT family N-acetyltransferase [Hyphomicrobiaceae bacterium]
MTSQQFSIRPGRREDAPVLAELVNYAGEGLPLYLWGKLAGPGQDAWALGRERAGRETGGFSFRNATIIEQRGEPVGGLIGYEIPDNPEPVSPDMPAMFVPLQELENLAPGTWYVNVLAVLPASRGSGLGSRLLAVAEEMAANLGKRGLSIIVADGNRGAVRLYERHGYVEIARRPMVKEEWVNAGENWVLLVKYP